MLNWFCQNFSEGFTPHKYCKLTVITYKNLTFNIIKVIWILSNLGLQHANQVVYL